MVGVAIGLAPIEERRHTVAFGGVDGLRRPEVAGQFVVHRMEAAVERPGRLPGAIRDEIMRWRVIGSARLRRAEGLGWPGRPLPFPMGARHHGAIRNPALLESALWGRHDGAGSNALHSPDDGGHIAGVPLMLAVVGVGFLPGWDLEQRQKEILPRCRVALVEALVVPAALGVAAGRHAGLLDDMRPSLA